MTKYTLTGSVRGNCGHQHTTIMGAARCSAEDQRDCQSQGGYSDRNLRVIEDGETRRPTEGEYLDFCDCIDRVRAHR
jgi:hypothetical protein